jgi:hypothetical protein
MKKQFLILLLFFIFFIFSPTAHAIEDIRLSEPMPVIGKSDEALSCTINVISSTYAGRIAVSSLWASQGITDKNQLLYNKTGEELGINVRHETEFSVVKGQNYGFTIIVTTNKPGIYQGIIKFKPLDTSEVAVQIFATWVAFDTRGIILYHPVSFTNQTNLTINGNFSRDLKDIEIVVNHNPVGTVSVDKNGEFSTDVVLQEGRNEIFAEGESTIDKIVMRSDTIRIILDTVPPEAPTITPHPAFVNTSKISISGNAEEDSIVHIFVNGVETNDNFASGSGNFMVSKIKLEKGNNTITAIAVDRAGNQGNESAPVYVVYNETVINKRIKLSADQNIITLPEVGNATCRITALVFDDNSTLIKNATLKINFSIVSGDGLISTEEVEVLGGKAETVIESGGAGDVTIKAEISSTDVEGDSLTITFTRIVWSLNDTNETVNASNAGGDLASLLTYVVTGIMIVTASIFLYVKVIVPNQEKKTEEDDESAWVVSGMRKADSGYEITVKKNNIKKTITLNEKFYKQLIKKRKLVFGEQTILIRMKK